MNIGRYSCLTQVFNTIASVYLHNKTAIIHKYTVCWVFFYQAAVSFENEINAEEKRLQASFEHLIVAMEGYFGKTLGHIQESLL